MPYTLGKASDLHDLTLPSGATCQARRPGVQGLISAGLLDNFDELTALVQTEHIGPNSLKGTAPKVSPDDVAHVAKILNEDKGKIHTAFLLVDRLAAYVVTEPKVWVDYQFKDEPDEGFEKRAKEAKEAGAIPVRAIDLDDKMFLLQWAVGGTSDLAEFRKGSQALMANVDASQTV